MTAPDAATVARSLSKAQRKMMIEAVTSTQAVQDRLEAMGLFIGERAAVRTHGSIVTSRTIPATFTPLGLAVRAALLKEQTYVE